MSLNSESSSSGAGGFQSQSRATASGQRLTNGCTPGAGGRFYQRLVEQEKEIIQLKEQYSKLEAHCERLEAWKDRIEKWIGDEFGTFDPNVEDNAEDEDEGQGQNADGDIDVKDEDVIGDNLEEGHEEDDFFEPSIVKVSGAGVRVPVGMALEAISVKKDDTKNKFKETVSTPGTSSIQARVHVHASPNKIMEQIRNQRDIQRVEPQETGNKEEQETKFEENLQKKLQKLKLRLQQEQSQASIGSRASSNNPSPSKIVNNASISSSPSKVNELNLRSPPTPFKKNVEEQSQSDQTRRRSSPRGSPTKDVGESPPKKKSKRDDQVASTSTSVYYVVRDSVRANNPKTSGSGAGDNDEVQFVCNSIHAKESQISTASSQGTKLEIEDDAPCAVCDDPVVESNNTVIFCDKCNLAVHQACYGVETVPSGKWFCNPCKANLDPSTLSCRFCLKKGGALKPVMSPSRKDWAHVWCTWWIPEIAMGSKRTQEPVMGIQNIHKDRYKLKCIICKVKGGVPIQCIKPKCKVSFHPTCAQEKGLRMDRLDLGETLELNAYCKRCGDREDAKDSA